jgi:hypothetical protein
VSPAEITQSAIAPLPVLALAARRWDERQPFGLIGSGFGNKHLRFILTLAAQFEKDSRAP